MTEPLHRPRGYIYPKKARSLAGNEDEDEKPPKIRTYMTVKRPNIYLARRKKESSALNNDTLPPRPLFDMKSKHQPVQIPQPGILPMTPHHPLDTPRHIHRSRPACRTRASQPRIACDEFLVGVQQLRLPRLGAEAAGRDGLDEGGEVGGGRGALEADVDGGFDDEEFEAGEVGVFGRVGCGGGGCGGGVDDRGGGGGGAAGGVGIAALRAGG